MFRYSPIVGVERFANAVWYRSKAKLKDVLEHRDSDTHTDSPQPYWFLPEIVEMIVAHLIYDTPTLKVCAATCFSWYNVATPHLHHTLTLRQWSPDTSHKHLNPLASLDKLGLLPFVKRVQFEKELFAVPWVIPATFDCQSMRYFGALENVQELSVAGLDFSKFPVGLGEYFGRFSHTLRSVALSGPRGTHRQLLDFLRLFSNLDDIKISCYPSGSEAQEELDTQSIPIGRGLRGRLTLVNFGAEGLLKDMIAVLGGMRFTSMDLQNVRGMRLVLEACADTLETLRIRPDDTYQDCKMVSDLWDPPNARSDVVLLVSSQYLNLSSNTVLRSLEIRAGSIVSRSQVIKELLSSITSPVFSEIVVVFSEEDEYRSWGLAQLAQVVCEMYGIKKFRLAFCLEVLEEWRVQNLRLLTKETEDAVARGNFDFLPCPLSVFSRVVTS